MFNTARLGLCISLFLAAGCGARVYQEWPFSAHQAQRRQEVTADALSMPVVRTVDLGNSVRMELVLIPAGEFVMGSEKGFEDELPRRRVTLTQPFYLSTYEVTQRQYEQVMGTNPSQFSGARNPVDSVSWADAIAFCEELSARTGLDVRLPTEAQWEYACRAGTDTAFYTGETIWTDQANFNGSYAERDGVNGLYRAKTLPVGSFDPNAFGLYDMHGNVWEWCADRYQGSYEGLATTDPTGPKTGDYRVFRGGAWYDGAAHCRSADRPRTHPGNGGTGLSGFRVMVSLAPRTDPNASATGPDAHGRSFSSSASMDSEGSEDTEVSADEVPELELEPCTIELVDGTTIEGKLAVQFDMPDHLIVYSPRLATVRSFLKEHVHAVTVDGERDQLNPRRTLTDEDRKLLGGVAWPCEPPATGHKPAYTIQKWDKPKALLVWARPGIGDCVEEPANWLLNGEPLSAIPIEMSGDGTEGPADRIASLRVHGSSLTPRPMCDRETDVLIPVAHSPYRLHYRSEGTNIALECRHLTTDTNAQFRPAYISRMEGNLWVRRGDGYLSARAWIRFSGNRHTFLINDNENTGLGPHPILDGGLPYLQNIYAHHIDFDKGSGSIEILGTVAGKYGMSIRSGTVIVGSRTMLMPGIHERFVVSPDAVVELQSGAILANYRGPRDWWPDHYDERIVIRGTLRAGSSDRPLTSSCYIGLSQKQPDDGERKHRGLVFGEGSRVEVHTSDADKARLVITHHGRDNAAGLVEVVFEDRAPMLSHVTFDFVRKGGIKLSDVSARRRWHDVRFAEECGAGEDEMFTSASP